MNASWSRLCGDLGHGVTRCFLIGGLTRYLIEKKPPEILAHAGTGGIDVFVIQLHMLADTDAYHTLEDNFKLGFERGTNWRR